MYSIYFPHGKKGWNACMLPTIQVAVTIHRVSVCSTEVAVVWRLREIHRPRAYGASVFLRWSEKLGLELKCSSREQAQRMAVRVAEVGRIDPDRWVKTFYPTWQWGCTTAMD